MKTFFCYSNQVLNKKAISKKNEKKERNLIFGMQQIMQKKKIKNHIRNKKSFFNLFIKTFFSFLKSEWSGTHMDNLLPARKKLLSFYDLETNKITIECKNCIGILWEFIGILIISLYIIFHIFCSIVCPIILYGIYFYIYSNQYKYIDYVIDLKFWILSIYMMLLIVTMILIPYKYTLIKIWYDCMFLEIGCMDQIDHINQYHSYIRDYRTIYNNLKTFFGALSSNIMQFLGMIDQNDIIILPSLEDIDINIRRNSCSESIVCDQYLFDMNVQ